MGWKFIGSTHQDSFIINGVDIFKEKWESTGERVGVVDPIYKQQFTFSVWRVATKDKIISFVAGEFSNGIFGIYQRKDL